MLVTCKESGTGPCQLLGNSPAIAALRADVDAAARSESKVLIQGETGAGKEIVARLIHERSPRAAHPLVAVNCAGVPDELLESELFGHVRGSFTAAYADKPGLAAGANGGTLFLDELGEMTPRMQALLLRFAETGEIQRLGSDRIDGFVDVRIIAATNRDLEMRVAAGAFRADLYYRLNVIAITVPPLRDRRADVLLLFDHFVAHYVRQHRVEPPQLGGETRAALVGYSWPGNVRELKNVAERLVVRCSGQPVTPHDLPLEIRRAIDAGSADSPVAAASAAAEAAWVRLTADGENFWAVVWPAFMDRTLTKVDVRTIVSRGLETTHGSYRKLISLFHMPPADYKRFLAFLQQHDCHVPFHSFRHIA